MPQRWAEEARAVMSIPPKKSLGQNFLVDPHAAAMILDAAGLTKDDTVVEIGPGHGVLTGGLAERAGKVIAVELDGRLIAKLRRELAGRGNLEIVHADALKYPFDRLPGRVKVVANLPYYISTPIITKLVSARSNISLMVLMLQKEVAERISAPPGGKVYGYLSVMVQLHCEAETLFTVPASSFDPAPKVESAVLRLAVREAPAAKCRDYRLFERVVSAAFSQRRKTLANSLRSSGLFSPEGIARLKGSGIDPTRRAETLSVSEYAALTDFLADFLFEFPSVK
jgi:16S rRNA (adenine1518-N6/adenine1519-N6)-dimethyltransferase